MKVKKNSCTNENEPNSILYSETNCILKWLRFGKMQRNTVQRKNENYVTKGQSAREVKPRS